MADSDPDLEGAPVLEGPVATPQPSEAVAPEGPSSAHPRVEPARAEAPSEASPRETLPPLDAPSEAISAPVDSKSEGASPTTAPAASPEPSPRETQPPVEEVLEPEEMRRPVTVASAVLDEPAPQSKRPPGISNLRPSKASIEGGTQIALFGAGFQEGCVVWMSNIAIEAEWVDAFCVRFIAPAHPVGFAHIEVANPDGLRSRTIVELDYERGPVISDLTPHEIPLEGGVEVTVAGEGFVDGSAINLFGVHAPAVLFDTSKRLRFVAPPVGAGPYEGPLIITNPDGMTVRIEHSIIYRALAPRIDTVEPGRGWITGGKAIEVRGVDFHSACLVSFGERPAEVRFKSPEVLEVVVPPGETVGPVDLILENPDGTSEMLRGGFTYESLPAPPKIIAVVPSSGSTAGGLVVRIAGDNFTEATKIRFADVTAVARFISAKVIEAELPPRSLPGAVAVEAVDAGITVRVEEAFTYASPKAPKVTGVDPVAGPATGGTKVVIEGEGFPANAVVRIGREAPKHVAIKGATRIEIVTPPSKSVGFVDVEVSSPETGPGVMRNGFRYDAVPAPTIESVAPNRGGINGGTELTVEGKNFVEGLTVTVGKRPAKRVKRISGSILEVITPDGDDGQMVDVVVKNPDGKEALAKRAFLYDARYRG